MGVRAAGDTKKLYTVTLGNSDDGASTSEPGGSEASLAEAMADVRQENGGDQVDFGGRKHLSKKQPVLTVNCTCICNLDIHIF